MRRPVRLSATFVRSVNVLGRYGDGHGGHGLSLLVKPAANGRLSKSWSQRIRVGGRISNIGLGAYPIVTLSLARKRALENRQAVEEGVNPLVEKRRAQVPTFGEAVETVIAIQQAGWKDGGKSSAQWRASLRDYALPRLGSVGVDAIGTSDVLAVLLPIWTEKRETARRVRQRVSAVMRWAIAQGHRGDNPAGEALGAVLPRVGTEREHYRALPYSQVGPALSLVRASEAWPVTKLALEFIVLTAARSGEARLARWSEVDVEGATWTVPAERMKAKRLHRVPLSSRALAVLAEAGRFADRSGLVFPSPTGRALSDSTLSKLLRDLQIGCVPHGFRSSFRDWCSETGVAREVAEAALAHVLADRVEAAYARSDLLARRRDVMRGWSEAIAPRV